MQSPIWLRKRYWKSPKTLGHTPFIRVWLMQKTPFRSAGARLDLFGLVNPYAITVMGSKTESRQKMEAAGVLQSRTLHRHSHSRRRAKSAKVLDIIMLKAVGGGGKDA